MKQLYLILLVLFFQACGSDENETNGFNTQPSLQIITHAPLPSQISVSPNLDKVVVTFNEALDANALNASNVIISGNISTSLSVSCSILNISLNERLLPAQKYRVEISDIAALSGSVLNNPYTFEFITCELTSTATYKITWDKVDDSDLKTYRLYYGKTTPIAEGNAIGFIETNLTSLEFIPSDYLISPCELFYLSVSAVGNAKEESFLSFELSQEAE